MSTEQTEGEKGEEDGKRGGRGLSPPPRYPRECDGVRGESGPKRGGKEVPGLRPGQPRASPPAPSNAAEANRTGRRAGRGHAGPPGRGGGAGPRRGGAGRPLGTLMVVVLRSSYLHSHSRQ